MHFNKLIFYTYCWFVDLVETVKLYYDRKLTKLIIDIIRSIKTGSTFIEKRFSCCKNIFRNCLDLSQEPTAYKADALSSRPSTTN